MNIKTKICGLTSEEVFPTLIENGAKYAGFVFYPPSVRNIQAAAANNLAQKLPESIKKVAVLVNPSDEFLEHLLANFRPDFLQLHGDEPPERIGELREKFAVPIIRALRIATREDLLAARQFIDCADKLLFDAKPSNTHLLGGTGQSFDWGLLKDFSSSLPWMLSGGLNIGNIAEALAISGAKEIDLSSAVEDSPGHKSPEKIAAFLQFVRDI